MACTSIAEAADHSVGGIRSSRAGLSHESGQAILKGPREVGRMKAVIRRRVGQTADGG